MVLNKAFEFPTRLHDLLDKAEEQGYDDVISWHRDGGFKIHDKEKLLPILHLSFRITKFKSFLRQLQAWGFHRVHCGPDKGLCTHELFKRGERSLLAGMKRKYSSSGSNSCVAAKNSATIAANSTTTTTVTDVPKAEASFPARISPSPSLAGPSSSPVAAAPKETSSSSLASMELAYLSTQIRLLVNHNRDVAFKKAFAAPSVFLSYRPDGTFVQAAANFNNPNNRMIGTSPFIQTFSNFENGNVVASPIVQALQGSKKRVNPYLPNLAFVQSNLSALQPQRQLWQSLLHLSKSNIMMP